MGSMKRFLILFIGASVAMLSGCATTTNTNLPVPIDHLRVLQPKMQAAYHWEMLAEYQSDLIVAAINNPGKLIYVDLPSEIGTSCGGNGCTPFNQAYHDMLQSNLVKKGARVVTDPAYAHVRISYTAQVIAHMDRAYVSWAHWFSASNGCAAANYVPWGYRESYWGYNGQNWGYTNNVAYWGYDGTRWGYNVPCRSYNGRGEYPYMGYGSSDHTAFEVIIVTQVTEGKLLLHSGTDIFYYDPADIYHYFNFYPSYQTATLKVVDQSGGTHE